MSRENYHSPNRNTRSHGTKTSPKTIMHSPSPTPKRLADRPPVNVEPLPDLGLSDPQFLQVPGLWGDPLTHRGRHQLENRHFQTKALAFESYLKTHSERAFAKKHL
jgi:hypothetical protein